MRNSRMCDIDVFISHEFQEIASDTSIRHRCLKMAPPWCATVWGFKNNRLGLGLGAFPFGRWPKMWKIDFEGTNFLVFLLFRWFLSRKNQKWSIIPWMGIVTAGFQNLVRDQLVSRKMPGLRKLKVTSLRRGDRESWELGQWSSWWCDYEAFAHLVEGPRRSLFLVQTRLDFKILKYCMLELLSNDQKSTSFCKILLNYLIFLWM